MSGADVPRISARPLRDVIEAMRSAGYSVADIARRSCLSPRTIQRLLRADTVAIHSADRIATALGRQLEELYAGVCRECGCTDLEACPGGCWWVEPDLCSACASGVFEDCR